LDEFDKHLIIAMVVALVIGMPLERVLKKRYKKQGRSIKYLTYKIYLLVIIPIVSIPFLLADVIPFWAKVAGVALGCIVGYFYLASVTSARKSFRKILGLSPEDEHTGEVIKHSKHRVTQ
jgi:hypothetical protein